jgi:hypothetical protein
MKQTLFLILLLASPATLRSQPFFPPQGKVYNDTIVPRVDVFMDPDSLEIMFNDLYTETEYTALFVFNDGLTVDTVENIGIRVRGNTSQTAEKKSFKISFNTFERGRKFYGFEKLNLNGEHNDPSIIRSKLYWETDESMQVPGPRANHIELYINGDYFGLYINVEMIDENFVKNRFGNNNGNLYKCLWPADLNYISDNPDDYKFVVVAGRRVYELQTNTEADDYTDLADFIHMIKFSSEADFPVELERMFNVNPFLRTYAIDVAAGNWDDYFYLMNNFYLYHNSETGKFEWIAYDTDNSFGIDWLGVDWGTRDLYEWINTGLNVQLIKRVLEVPEYIDRITFFSRQLQSGMMDTSIAFPRIDFILNLIKESAEADSFRTLDYGWDYDDFLRSYTEGDDLGFHVWYGLKPYFVTRHSSTESQLQSTNVKPIISRVNHLPKTVHEGDEIVITAWVEDEEVPISVKLYYRINSEAWTTLDMADDGLHDDGPAGNGTYGVFIDAPGILDTIYFYISARDVINQVSREPRIDNEAIVVEPVPHLVFNELMASNSFTVADPYQEYDDWLELYNADTFPVFLGNRYLSDEPGNPDKWRLPDEVLPPGGWMLIWCDDQTWQGAHHAGFKLSAAGETVTLFEGTGLAYQYLDSISWAGLAADVAIGCYPDGVLPIHELEAPTPGFSNLNVGIEENPAMASAHVYPNPVHDVTFIRLRLDKHRTIEMDWVNLLGETAYRTIQDLPAGISVIPIGRSELNQVPPGIYLVRITDANNPASCSLISKVVKQ